MKAPSLPPVVNGVLVATTVAIWCTRRLRSDMTVLAGPSCHSRCLHLAWSLDGREGTCTVPAQTHYRPSEGRGRERSWRQRNLTSQSTLCSNFYLYFNQHKSFVARQLSVSKTTRTQLPKSFRCNTRTCARLRQDWPSGLTAIGHHPPHTPQHAYLFTGSYLQLHFHPIWAN